jgi:radical SAM superfamily enzyme YgiQ (UPF0313 family)
MIMNSFEQGPIRPPSEAQSLLIRATRNCPWNKCTFCHTYRGTTFELRSLAEIKKDVETARNIADEIRTLSWQFGAGGAITQNVIEALYQNPKFNEAWQSVLAWLYFGGESVFIQDGNSIIMKTDELCDLLQFIREKFPSVKRITSYCRAKTAARKTVEEFQKLHAAGLTRIHIGMESGYDPLLAYIRKGVTAAEQIEGGRNIRLSGISLSEYVMPGLGGVRWSREHAVETARVLNQIGPDYVRLRTFQPVPGTELFDAIGKGEFELLSEDDIVKEIRLFIENLEGVGSRIVSDHIMNLLEEVEGKLPEDKLKLLAVLDRFLGLSPEDRAIFTRGRRRGMYRQLDDLSDQTTYDELKLTLDYYRKNQPGKLEKDLTRIRQRFI